MKQSKQKTVPLLPYGAIVVWPKSRQIGLSVQNLQFLFSESKRYLEITPIANWTDFSLFVIKAPAWAYKTDETGKQQIQWKLIFNAVKALPKIDKLSSADKKISTLHFL